VQNLNGFFLLCLYLFYFLVGNDDISVPVIFVTLYYISRAYLLSAVCAGLFIFDSTAVLLMKKLVEINSLSSCCVIAIEIATSTKYKVCVKP
jgi:dolichyl-phosphate-mannose--protein O-mannosyl transferase